MVDVAFLTRVRIFANLNGKQLQSLPDKLQPRRYQRGEVIFHEDDPADRMHIIVDGRVKISIASEDGRERDIALFQSGDCFGEMALLDGSNRSATATAVDATETMVLFRQGFLDFLGENPELARLVGASRETVSRALNSYRRMGMLDTSHRRITITDLARLERMASF